MVFPLPSGAVQYIFAPLFMIGILLLWKGVGTVISKNASFSLISECNFLKGIGIKRVTDTRKKRYYFGKYTIKLSLRNFI